MNKKKVGQLTIVWILVKSVSYGPVSENTVKRWQELQYLNPSVKISIKTLLH